jgi:hypothetical protein
MLSFGDVQQAVVKLEIGLPARGAPAANGVGILFLLTIPILKKTPDPVHGNASRHEAGTTGC